VPTNSNAYMAILRKLVDLWRRASGAPQAGEVMNKTPAKKQAEQGTSVGSKRDQTPRRD
jgi:hypothetical protein